MVASASWGGGGKPVKIYDAWNSWQAQLLTQQLAAQGIMARVASTAIEALTGKVPYQDATCQVWVAANDEERARREVKLFDQHWAEKSISELANTDFCYHCGSAIEIGQTPCPQCHKALDWTP